MTDMLWEPEELFGWLMKTLREDFALFPSEIYYLSPPVEALEDLLIQRVVYRNTARRYIQVFASKGWISEAWVERFKTYKSPVKVTFVGFDGRKIPNIVPPELAALRATIWMDTYSTKFGKRITKDTTLPMDEARNIEAWSMLPRVGSIFMSLVDKGVRMFHNDPVPFNFKLHWTKFWGRISPNYSLWEALELLGIIEWSDDETIRFLMGAEEAEAALKKAPPLYEDPEEGGMKLLTKG